MAEFDDEPRQDDAPESVVVVQDSGMLAEMIGKEFDIAIATAKKFPRVLKDCKTNTLELAAADKETAESCFFTLPRKKKNEQTGKMEDVEIEGESIRLAEIVATSWKNLKYATRIINIDRIGKKITAQAVVHDLENNTSASVEETKNIVGKSGKIFTEDMIVMTGRAAQSVALRNAIFKVVPKAFFRQIIKEVKEVAIGNKPGFLEDPKNFKKEPLPDRIKKAVKFFINWGIPEERLFHTLGVKSLEEMTEEHLIKLTGIRSGINQGEFTLTEAFPLTDADKSKDVGQAIMDKLKDKAPQLSPEEMAQKAKDMANAKNNPSMLSSDEIAEGTGKKAK